MPQPPAMFPEATAIFAVLSSLTVFAISAFPGFNRDAAFFALGAAAAATCAVGLTFIIRRNPPAGSDRPALHLLESVAEELKSTLHTINGLSETIRQWSAREGAEWRGSCDDLVEATRQLALFTSQLHDYARFERGALRLREQQVDAAELTASALAACGDKVEQADIFITADLSHSAELCCDALRIQQAITSLVVWVAETSPPGSRIDVNLMRRADHGLDIHIRSPAGMAAKAITAALFEPHVPFTGLGGLALPIARRVALLHAGHLKVEATPGAGTSASLSLPAHRVDWQDMAKPIPPRAS